jgi:hypothetical protein
MLASKPRDETLRILDDYADAVGRFERG